jgi:hypothetical protein
MKSILIGIKNVLLWSYERGTWQYDVLCLLIILAVFLVPSKYFGDRDRTRLVETNEIRQNASQDMSLAGSTSRLVDAGELMDFLKRQNKTELARLPEEALTLYLRDQLKREVELVDVKPFYTPNGNAGYDVRFKH